MPKVLVRNTKDCVNRLHLCASLTSVKHSPIHTHIHTPTAESTLAQGLLLPLGGAGIQQKEACTHSGVRPQLDEEPLALEAQLADLGPVEGVDPGVALYTRGRGEHLDHCWT